ncbi:hypothetical protein TEA_016414 [Camellia sinensis var. sinensis]|uniref:MLO-like protein n=1 Tax=Camellia sinensis var. sinensis TaxID=542762 RepID=A0A4S4EE40_CAMSN|nr:hypothetical protein TEA_016414 [Camellia sinensis var. sinensis]
MSGEAGLRSLEDTPTWAVATICFVLISSSLGHAWMTRHPHANDHKQKFMSSLIGISFELKTSTSTRRGGSLYFKLLTRSNQGKLSLLSRTGVRQLQFLIFVLALFHVFSCFLTFSLGMAKACFFRQFYKSVSEVDYFTLRHGFIMAHFAEGSHFDFQKYLKRVLEKDFGVVVGISFWIWIFSVVFIFLNAHVFYSYFWLPFIPLVMLLIVGTKLQAIITRMCLDTNDKSLIVLGTLLVRPSDHYFWFERPKLLLHLMHFILFQNSFQLAFFTWTWLCMLLVVHILCGYVTLPLYALVTQMGTSMKKVVLTEEMVKGLKRWRAKAKKNLARRNTSSTLHSLDASITSLDTSPSFNTLHRSPSVDLDNLSIDGDFVAVEVKNEDNVAGKRVEHHQKFGSFRGFDLREAL